MTPTVPRLQTALDLATDRLRTTFAGTFGPVAERLSGLARSSTRIAERDLLNAGQFELRRHAGALQREFERALRERIAEDVAPPAAGRRSLAAADWQSLALVDDREVEDRMAADRLGQQLVQESDEELGALERLFGALRPRAALRDEPEPRNPLRGEVLGAALHRALAVVSTEADVRRVVGRELGAAFAKVLPPCLAGLRDELQRLGVRAAEPTWRGVEGPGNQLPGVNSAYQTLDEVRSQHGASPEPPQPPAPNTYIDPDAASRLAAFLGGVDTLASRRGDVFGPSRTDSGAGSRPAGVGARPLPHQLDPQLMARLRQWNALAASGAGPLGTRAPALSPGGFLASQRGTAYDDHFGGSTWRGHPSGAAPHADAPPTDLMAVNLIHAHREELRQLAGGQLDGMVIDLIGALFDQILSDSRVPPQMARQIARLQLPVLRVALADPAFFSSRRHPVRRFVNRIASLACAFDDFDGGPGQLFLERVRELIAEIVEGDFDQIELYAAKLEALERHNAEQTARDVEQRGAAETLSAKETELRLQQRYVLQLQAALRPLNLPDYLRDFLSQVWSQALVLAAARDGADADRTQRFRRVGRDLVTSVLPKGSPPLRKRFLMQLPALMKDLNEGIALIGWSPTAQREFMARLLPAHAESLKAAPISELDHNLLAKQLEQIFAMPVPGQETLTPTDPVPEVAPEALEQRFTPEEAARVGLVTESAVDWSGTVDIDLGEAGLAHAATAEAHATTPGEASSAGALDIDLGAAPERGRGDTPTATSASGPRDDAGANEADRGALIDHLKLGFAYRMLLKDEWQKVRLAHISPGRGFFVFTRGHRHQETISMTARMLTRMCANRRFRVVENQYLVDRATQRARKQLATLGPAG